MTDKEKEKHGNAQDEGEKGKDEGSRESEHEEHKKKKRKEDALEELKANLEGKEKEIEELKEKLLYHQADFDNFKKLKAKEKQEVLRFGNETLIKELLPVIDNLERAIEHAGKTEEAKGHRRGGCPHP